MTIGSLTGIVRKPVCFLIALDANVRLHFDDLNVLTCSQAFSYGLDSSIKNAQVLGLFVQAWASQMLLIMYMAHKLSVAIILLECVWATERACFTPTISALWMVLATPYLSPIGLMQS